MIASTPSKPEKEIAAPGSKDFDAFKWQQAHKRPDFRGDIPVSGFGPAGIPITLWIRRPDSAARWVIDGGKAARRVETGALDGRLMELRDLVLESFATVGPGLLEVDARFLEYVAAVIAQNYSFTDDELTLLLSGDKWHGAMATHLAGGDDYLQSLMKAGPVYLNRLIESEQALHPMPLPVAESDDLPLFNPQPIPTTQPVPKRRWWWPFSRR